MIPSTRAVWSRLFRTGERPALIDDLLPVALYTLITLVVVAPALPHLNSTHAGGDFYYIWMAWWRRVSLLTGQDFFFQPVIQAPFGTDQITPGFSGTIWMLTLLSIPFGYVAANNLISILSHILSGIFTCLVARRLSFGRPASFLAGAIFAFSRFELINNRIDTDTASQWVLPLFLLGLINLHHKQTPLAALWLGLAFAIAAFMHPYYGYFTVILAVLFAAVQIYIKVRAEGWRFALDARWVGLYVLSAVVGIVAYLPDLYPSLRGLGQVTSPVRDDNMLMQPLEQFFHWSSRPWDFLIPPTDHPLYGGLARSLYDRIANMGRLDFIPPVIRQNFNLDMHWFWRSGEPSEEHGLLYLGFTNLFLAAYAILHWRRTQPAEQGRPDRRMAMVLALVLLVAGFLFTLPPYLPVGALLRPIWAPLHNWVIPTPSLFTLKVVPPMRYAIRFVTFMMLGLGLLAAYSLERFQEKWSPRITGYGVAALVIGLLALEYGVLPYGTPLPVPEVYTRLAALPDDTLIATYPWHSRASYFQHVHGLSTLNTISRPGTPLDGLANLEAEVALGDIRDPDVPAKLAALGADVVVYSGEPLSPEPEGLEPLFTTGTDQVFRVTAEPVSLAVLFTPRSGLWMSENTWSWASREHVIYIWNPLSSDCVVDIEVSLSEPAGERALSAVLQLSPQPTTVIRQGEAVANPNLRADYSSLPLVAVPGRNLQVFETVRIYPGETLLTLRWSGVDPYPVVLDVRFLNVRAAP